MGQLQLGVIGAKEEGVDLDHEIAMEDPVYPA